ncbi:phenol hydroxylase subunit P4 [Massilia litorea]|uniref:Phenol hydroxylase subunit P4 n=1 Tax=Massilia litorea TaxID=2769491 RepID=A0A7L9U0B3_9BURK|nr:phenol hydroxylase subunit P4 [Massilia litorea]QOL48483.1 phenol hydroxylase subunit P4 [Massilia litorea]
MPVIALAPDYRGEVRDRVENFHGNQLVYFGWDRRMLFCSPFTLPLPPDMPFKTLVSDVLTPLLAAHPEGASIDWSTATWLRAGQPFVPEPEASLVANGLGHKTVLRLQTPQPAGVGGSGN